MSVDITDDEAWQRQFEAWQQQDYEYGRPTPGTDAYEAFQVRGMGADETRRRREAREVRGIIDGDPWSDVRARKVTVRRDRDQREAEARMARDLKRLRALIRGDSFLQRVARQQYQTVREAARDARLAQEAHDRQDQIGYAVSGVPLPDISHDDDLDAVIEDDDALAEFESALEVGDE